MGRAAFHASSNQLYILAPLSFWGATSTGDSVAVNGCCLTLLHTPKNGVGSFFVMEETRKLTALTQLYTFEDCSLIPPDLFSNQENFSIVNLELCLRWGQPLGGHVLSGHVDGIGEVVELVENTDKSWTIWFEVGREPLQVQCEHLTGSKLLTPKGSIAVDGVSLTVNEVVVNVDYVTFRVNITPYTWQVTRLKYAHLGQMVNIEFDRTDEYLTTRSINKSVEENGHSFDNQDEYFMRRAIEVGERGRITAPPNPWVGCVIVNFKGQVIGEGAHMKAGTAHAEVVAVKAAIDGGHPLEGSTIYTTLEPCSHFGRTPPCVDILIQHKIGRVVVAVTDPDTKVNGRGIAELRKANITVSTGVLENEASKSLQPYVHHRTTGFPWVVLKLATSLDGKIAYPTESAQRWISGQAARMDTHRRWRSTSQAILVGASTAALDNPLLTTRSEEANTPHFTQPLRIVVGTDWRKWPLGSNLLDTSIAPTLIFTSEKAFVPSSWEKEHKVEVGLPFNSDLVIFYIYLCVLWG
ncbi:lumazine binding domain-containing protein [Ditylenchus destructor]|uniref:Lumazine binding domain-containing protein n=1 Tax=Ditylenchus destructor TaxID=166010 RepID=A0AAD4NAQ6_9BILA|nr:lumazine binding domain-containing protein [Ditylenchus destructor]